MKSWINQVNKKATDKGSINLIKSFNDIFLLYLFIQKSIKGTNGSKGDIGFVTESAILKVNWENSAENPKFINNGTAIGAIIIHLADKEPINKFNIVDKIINTTIKI